MFIKGAKFTFKPFCVRANILLLCKIIKNNILISLSYRFIVMISAKLLYEQWHSIQGNCCIDHIDWSLMLVRYNLFQLFYVAVQWHILTLVTSWLWIRKQDSICNIWATRAILTNWKQVRKWLLTFISILVL